MAKIFKKIIRVVRVLCFVILFGYSAVQFYINRSLESRLEFARSEITECYQQLDKVSGGIGEVSRGLGLVSENLDSISSGIERDILQIESAREDNQKVYARLEILENSMSNIRNNIDDSNTFSFHQFKDTTVSKMETWFENYRYWIEQKLRKLSERV